MKALELLYRYQQADEIAGGYMSEPIGEAIKELEELNATQKTTKNKFKIGDWVVYPVGIRGSEEILQITNIDEKGFCSFRDCSKMYQIDKLSLWKPKPGEWCWVFDDKSQIPVLRKFVCTHDKENSILFRFYIVEEHDRTNLHYRYIEPFIGALPSTIEQY